MKIPWFFGVLATLGSRRKEAKILFLGLDNAGKTTLLHIVIQHQLTQFPTCEEPSIGKIDFKVFDLGGHEAARRVWKDYYTKVDAVVYLFDACEAERFAESKTELANLLKDESLATVPFLHTTGKGKTDFNASVVRPIEVFMCSIVRKMGYGDGFRW
ncbi:hypothetical protein C5167_009926, partial [Papaver somniferum]